MVLGGGALEGLAVHLMDILKTLSPGAPALQGVAADLTAVQPEALRIPRATK
jgi:hypothetical protein